MSRANRFKGIAGRAFGGRSPVDETAETTPPLTGPATSSRLPGARVIALTALEPDPAQPRRQFVASKLEELAQSIREHGILQPILVSHVEATDTYRIIAGERRYRAAKLAGLETAPCLVVAPADDAIRIEQQLVENLQREQLTALEECAAFDALRELYGLTHQQIAERVGKSRTYVTKTLALRNIPPAELARLSAAGVTTREHLVLVGQQRDSGAMRQLVDALTTETPTVRELRESAAPARKRASGDATRRIVRIALDTGATITVSLPAAKSSSVDLVAALERALAAARSGNIGS
jgi:ParB family transcriptional regulator, chromosome partitioning protein